MKPLRLVRVIVDLPVVPAGILRLLGLAVIVKSGAGVDETTVKVTLTLCDVLPLVPVTFTTQLVGGVPVVVKARIEVAVPPGERSTLDGLTPQFGHETQSGAGDVVSLTVPLKLLMLVSMIWDLGALPATTVWLDGSAEIVESGEPEDTTVNVTGAEWERLQLVPGTATLYVAGGVWGGV